ncbi:MAG: ABC transporter ATP-binding protein, partial [Duncaniella sp.]|nr:ABC transporter ATP-binding protein [Duncaniella sp.]
PKEYKKNYYSLFNMVAAGFFFIGKPNGENITIGTFDKCNNMYLKKIYENIICIYLMLERYLGFYPKLTLQVYMSDYDRMVVRAAISLVGIEPLRGRMVQTLSDGERQKVMIAKALAQETPVIFLDEPTAFLDYPSKVEIMQLLQTLSRERDKTVFLSTHDLELALQIADKVWLLDKPHGVTMGTPEDLALKGEMTKYFHREGVSFDIESGLFKIEHRLTQMLTLEGNGPVADMIRKALARHGVAVTHEKNENIIYVDDSEIRLNGDTYPDIDSLLEAVDTLFDCR